MNKSKIQKSLENSKEKNITQERLKEVLNYDPKTGIFMWRVGHNRIKAGNIAGTLHVDGYIQIRIDGKLYMAHRLAFLFMDGYFPEFDVDHKNRVRNDNRWVNLRHVSRSCNLRNCSLSKANKCGVTGVKPNENSTSYKVYITIMGKRLHLGCFNTLVEAARTRWEAEIKYGFPNCNTTSSAYLFLKDNDFS